LARKRALTIAMLSKASAAEFCIARRTFDVYGLGNGKSKWKS
jgi:hypothetical protein